MGIWVPSIDARGMPKRSAKYRSSPAIAPQLPATLVFAVRNRERLFEPL